MFCTLQVMLGQRHKVISLAGVENSAKHSCLKQGALGHPYMTHQECLYRPHGLPGPLRSIWKIHGCPPPSNRLPPVFQCLLGMDRCSASPAALCSNPYTKSSAAGPASLGLSSASPPDHSRRRPVKTLSTGTSSCPSARSHRCSWMKRINGQPHSGSRSFRLCSHLKGLLDTPTGSCICGEAQGQSPLTFVSMMDVCCTTAWQQSDLLPTLSFHTNTFITVQISILSC